MTGFIPREKLTAYQRWELEAFDEEEQDEEKPDEAEAEEESPKAETPPQTEPEPEAEIPEAEIIEQPQVVLPTAAEIERMHNEAREQGYAEGRAEGHAEGRSAGHEEGRAEGYAEGMAGGQALTARIAEILESLEQAAEGIEQHVAEQLLSTAVEIASQVLRQSLKIKPELILPVVREAVAALQIDSGHPVLRAHPDDAGIIRAQMGDTLTHNNWRIIEDASLTPGGCRVELGASEVDATLETRWKRVIETIGVNRDWLSDRQN
ncbi:flagellar assembly protein FliH [Betaproteobacteria bacterium]|nr:flagellar assembly protein FliH [Betaproteobacteria bacterium]